MYVCAYINFVCQLYNEDDRWDYSVSGWISVGPTYDYYCFTRRDSNEMTRFICYHTFFNISGMRSIQ